MSPDQFQFLRNRLLTKILINGLPCSADILNDPRWKLVPFLRDTPWLWTGAALPTTSSTRNPIALIRSPGLPAFPYTKNQVVPVHRLLHHILIAPVTPHDQVRYRKGMPIHDRPNVNPCHHQHHQGPVYVYEPPSLEEAGGYSELEELRAMLKEGTVVSELLIAGYTQEEIDVASAE